MRFRLALLLSLLTVVPIASPTRAQTAEVPVVRAVMFWMAGCPHCEDVIQNVLPPLYEKYGAQFDLLMLEVGGTQDMDTLYRVAQSYHIPKEQTGVPFLIIGDRVLVGSAQVRELLPRLIDDYLNRGGVDWPKNAILTDFLPTVSPASSSISNPPTVKKTPIPAETVPASSIEEMQPNGFTLAIVLMIVMTASLIYSLIAFAFAKTSSMPAWTDWLIPLFILAGIVVAGYLSYIETQSATAACGPVGDCNTVQQSRYAKLFDVLPIGVFGLLGYLGLLIAWLVRKFMRHFKRSAAVGFWGMAFFAVIFSLYLTYLEPFIIKAVCIWCLTSAVIVTLLLLLGTPPALRQFAEPEDE